MRGRFRLGPLAPSPTPAWISACLLDESRQSGTPVPLRHTAPAACRGCRAKPNPQHPVETDSAIGPDESLPLTDSLLLTPCVPEPFWQSGHHDAATVSDRNVGSMTNGASWCTTRRPNRERLRQRAIHPTGTKATPPE